MFDTTSMNLDGSYNLKEICRTCLTDNSTSLTNIFDTTIDDCNLSEVLMKYVALKVIEEDHFPKSICDNCVQKVIQFCEFKKKCDESQRFLNDLVKNIESRLKADIETVKNRKKRSSSNSRDIKSEDSDHLKAFQKRKPKKSMTSSTRVTTRKSGNTQKSNKKKKKEETSTEELKLQNIKDDANVVKKATNRKYIRKKKRIEVKSELKLEQEDKENSDISLDLPDLDNADIKRESDVKKESDILADDYSKDENSEIEEIDKDLEELKKTKSKGYGRYICDICAQVFTFKSNVKRHMLRHTGERPHMCDICGKGFTQVQCLKQHKITLHGVGEDAQFECKFCDRKFVQLSKKIWHERIHESKVNGSSVCRMCCQTLSCESALRTHMLIHHEKTHLCNFCGRGFHMRSGLMIHLKVHTGEKPYACDQCPKLFSQYSSLKVHKLVHSGEKPHECKVCGKKFTQSPHLIYHMRSHTGERPYKCTFCEKGFKNREMLKVHERIHTGETPYLCDLCRRGFYDASSLRKHKKTHLEKPLNVSEALEVKKEIEPTVLEGMVSLVDV